jgi:hypothetical protein
MPVNADARPDCLGEKVEISAPALALAPKTI